MRMRGIKGVRRFQTGGVNATPTQGGWGGQSPVFSPQQQAAMQQMMQQRQAAQQGAGAAGGAGGANPLAQQLAARGAMPTPAAGSGAASTLGAAAPGGMMPQGVGGTPGAAGPAGMGNFQPRPGVQGGMPGGMQGGMPQGQGGMPQASLQGMPQGAPGGGAPQGMPGAMQSGLPQSAPQGMPMPQGMPGGMMVGQGGMPQGQGGMPQGLPGGMQNPQQQAALQALLASRQQQGAAAGMAKGGRVVPQKGMTTGPIQRSANKVVAQQGMTTGPTRASANKIVPQKGTTGPIRRTPERSFDSTKPAPGNLPTRPGKAKMADGGPVNRFNSLKSVGGNLPLQRQEEPLKKARGGRTVLRRRPESRAAEDRRSPSPVPTYDRPVAGDDGWPPTPNFTGAPGPNLPPPTPNPVPQAAAPTAMAKGGRAQRLGPRARVITKKIQSFRKAKGGECVEDKDKDRMRKGGECDRMAAGGAAKERKGFPNTIAPPKRLKLARGGSVRGAGVAERGTHFSGIY